MMSTLFVIGLMLVSVLQGFNTKMNGQESDWASTGFSMQTNWVDPDKEYQDDSNEFVSLPIHPLQATGDCYFMYSAEAAVGYSEYW